MAYTRERRGILKFIRRTGIIGRTTLGLGSAASFQMLGTIILEAVRRSAFPFVPLLGGSLVLIGSLKVDFIGIRGMADESDRTPKCYENKTNTERIYLCKAHHPVDLTAL